MLLNLNIIVMIANHRFHRTKIAQQSFQKSVEARQSIGFVVRSAFKKTSHQT